MRTAALLVFATAALLAQAALPQPPEPSNPPRDVGNCDQQDEGLTEMLAEAPRDPLVVKLYALRSGLCELVLEGVVDVDLATEIFNREWRQAVEQRRREQREQQVPGA